MSTEKLDEQMSLECPKCGGVEFVFDGENEDSEPTQDQVLQCVKCGHELMYSELILANADSVDQRVQEIGADFAKDLTQNLEDAIKKLGFGKK